MLQPAICYKEQLMELYHRTWFDEKYKYYNADNWVASINVDDSTWNKHQFVSVLNGRVIGYIAYDVCRADDSVVGLRIINFTDNTVAFGVDLREALRNIFEKFHFRKLVWSVLIGNPVESSYDKIADLYGGRIVGTYYQDVKLMDGTFCDQKFYELLASDYFNSDGYKRSRKEKTHEEKRNTRD